MPPVVPVQERIRRRSVEDGSCWIWTGTPAHGGYATMKVRGRWLGAHRASYEAFIGPIPKGMVLDHLCKRPLCVNPAHLEPVTQRVNVLRGDTLPAANAAKTECKHGHSFDADNTYITPDGRRECRACRYAAALRYRRKKVDSIG